jgi:hypothetical protein
MLYGAHHSHEHGGGLHAHGSGGPATAAHSHPEVALLVAGAGLAIVGLTWLLLPDGRHPRLPAQVALCSAAAATIHFAVIPPHWEEYAPFAVLFALSGAFQLLWAAAASRLNSPRPQSGSRSSRRSLCCSRQLRHNERIVAA